MASARTAWAGQKGSRDKGGPGYPGQRRSSLTRFRHPIILAKYRLAPLSPFRHRRARLFVSCQALASAPTPFRVWCCGRLELLRALPKTAMACTGEDGPVVPDGDGGAEGRLRRGGRQAEEPEQLVRSGGACDGRSLVGHSRSEKLSRVETWRSPAPAVAVCSQSRLRARHVLRPEVPQQGPATASR